MSDLSTTDIRWLSDQQPDDTNARLLALLFGDEPAPAERDNRAPLHVLHGAA